MKNFFQFKNITISLTLLLVFYACANRGQGPQGGAKDEVPPRFVKSTPREKSVNVKDGKIEIEFDENVNLKDISKNVIISPPQRINPEITSYGRKVNVRFDDSLQSNTTYSIDFGNAIVDNNEGNILKNYVFSFATGNEIDTMQIAGTLLNAEDLNPLQGITVGIHNDLSDSAFLKKPFLRIARTDEQGRFTVSNVRNGIYRVFALNDLNRDYFLQKGEALAFDEKSFQTGMENITRPDTVWKDSITVDTIRFVPAIRYLPDDVVLRYFKDDYKRQYLAKSERPEPHLIKMFFNTSADKLPEIRPLNVNWDKSVLLQKNQRLDSLTYWLTDSALIKTDTITLEVKYLKTDSLFKLQPQTDTIKFVMKKPAKKPSATGKKKEFLDIQTNLSPQFDVYKPVMLTFQVPVKSYEIEKIHLSQLVDTVLTPIQFVLEKKDSIGMNFQINHKWIPETTYQLLIDSAAFTSVYNLHSDNLKNELKIKSLDQYSGLKLLLANYDSTAILQVVNKDDKLIRTAPVLKGGTKVEYLEPGDYYLRMFLDRNGNGKWDPGNYFEKRQPESVYYYEKKLTLIKNWEFEETWDHTALPLLKQKPQELKKSDQQKPNNQ